MKISKLLNKKNYLIFLFFIFFNISLANEPVDIWNIDKNKIESNQDDQGESMVSSEESDNSISIYDLNNQNQNQNENKDIVLQENKIENKISLYGLYDPDENNLSIDMWKNSEGEEIKKIFNKIYSQNLSKDAKDILEIALLTNSNVPSINITREEFYILQKDFLIKKNDLDLIKLFIEKNPDFIGRDDLVNYYANHYLAKANIEKSCEIFDVIDEVTSDYTSKLKIYCLVNSNQVEKALLIFDLKKEMGMNDNYFEKKIFELIGFETQPDGKISDKNLLELHLSHRTVENFNYLPNENTSKDIWKYLASANLLEKIENIDLEDIEKINLIEKATHERNYDENQLFNLYTRYQFSFNQLYLAKNNYKTLDKSSQRALIYQKMLLTNEPIEKLDLARLLKKLFENDNLGNAFYSELSKILTEIDSTKITSEFTSFYQNNIITEESEIKKIKFNNKIIHQSKLLNYFIENNDNSKTEKEINDLLKSILKDKKYIITTSDEIILESFKYDGIKIQKKFTDRYKPKVNIPPDLQVKINNRDLGLILLRFVEIIGEDKLEDLGSETLNFILITLNQLDLDQIRNKIILKTLPIRV
tara:strand:- start:39 stop:1808 length:1770 start_codon:yes stop_codon:yes gene_type:complete